MVPESQPVADNCAAMVSMTVEGVMLRLTVAWRGAEATAHTGAALPAMEANWLSCGALTASVAKEDPLVKVLSWSGAGSGVSRSSIGAAERLVPCAMEAGGTESPMPLLW